MKRSNWSLQQTQLFAKTLMLSPALAAGLLIFDVASPLLSDASAQAVPEKKVATPEIAPAPKPHALASQSEPSLASQSQGKASGRTKR